MQPSGLEWRHELRVAKGAEAAGHGFGQLQQTNDRFDQAIDQQGFQDCNDVVSDAP